MKLRMLIIAVLFVGPFSTPAGAASDIDQFKTLYAEIRGDWPLLPADIIFGAPLPTGSFGWMGFSGIDGLGRPIFQIQPGWTLTKAGVAHETGHALAALAEKRGVPAMEILWQVRGFPGTAADHMALLRVITDQRQLWAQLPEESFAETFALCASGAPERTENYGHPIDQAHACALASMVMLGGYSR